MSIRVMTEVWDRSEHKGSTLLLLLAIADFANDAGYAYPAVATLAQKCRMSERNIQYLIQDLEQSGELVIQRGTGRNATNLFRVMIERNRGLFDDTGKGAKFAPPPVDNPVDNHGPAPGKGEIQREKGCNPASKRVNPVAPEPSLTVKEPTTPRGGKPPPAGESTVSRCWQVYRDGIKRIYGTDYPPSASVNGKLARVVALVGKENAPGVVGYYLGSADPWYKRTQHKLDFLVRDAAQLCMQMQQAAGTVAGEPIATTSRVLLVATDGHIQRDLGNGFPIGDPLEIARTAAAEYGRMMASLKPAYLVVRQGAKSSRFTPQEIST